MGFVFVKFLVLTPSVPLRVAAKDTRAKRREEGGKKKSHSRRITFSTRAGIDARAIRVGKSRISVETGHKVRRKKDYVNQSTLYPRGQIGKWTRGCRR